MAPTTIQNILDKYDVVQPKKDLQQTADVSDLENLLRLIKTYSPEAEDIVRQRITAMVEWTIGTTKIINELSIGQSFWTSLKNKVQKSLVGQFIREFNSKGDLSEEDLELKFEVMKYTAEKTEFPKTLERENDFVDDLIGHIRRQLNTNKMIKYVDFVKTLKHLRLLDAKVGPLDKNLARLASLEALVLSCNLIDNLPRAAWSPRGLLFLELNCNLVKDIVKDPPNLIYLSLGDNMITDASNLGSLSLMNNLVSLDLSDNKLRDFDCLFKILRQLPHLSSLCLIGNPCAVMKTYKSNVMSGLPKLVFLDKIRLVPAEVLPPPVPELRTSVKGALIKGAHNKKGVPLKGALAKGLKKPVKPEPQKVRFEKTKKPGSPKTTIEPNKAPVEKKYMKKAHIKTDKGLKTLDENIPRRQRKEDTTAAAKKEKIPLVPKSTGAMARAEEEATKTMIDDGEVARLQIHVFRIMGFPKPVAKKSKPDHGYYQFEVELPLLDERLKEGETLKVIENRLKDDGLLKAKEEKKSEVKAVSPVSEKKKKKKKIKKALEAGKEQKKSSVKDKKDAIRMIGHSKNMGQKIKPKVTKKIKSKGAMKKRKTRSLSSKSQLFEKFLKVDQEIPGSTKFKSEKYQWNKLISPENPITLEVPISNTHITDLSDTMKTIINIRLYYQETGKGDETTSRKLVAKIPTPATQPAWDQAYVGYVWDAWDHIIAKEYPNIADVVYGSREGSINVGDVAGSVYPVPNHPTVHYGIGLQRTGFVGDPTPPI